MPHISMAPVIASECDGDLRTCIDHAIGLHSCLTVEQAIAWYAEDMCAQRDEAQAELDRLDALDF